MDNEHPHDTDSREQAIDAAKMALETGRNEDGETLDSATVEQIQRNLEFLQRLTPGNARTVLSKDA